MMTDPVSPSQPAAPGKRVAGLTVSQRRRRVIRSLLTVLGVTLIIVVLSISNRDEQAVEGCRQRMEVAVKTFRQHHAEWLRDPRKFPLTSVETRLGDIWREHVLDNWRFTEQAAFAREVGICCCEQPHSRLVRVSGRHVIIYNVARQEYTLVWMDEPEFQRRAEELGFRIGTRP